MYLYAHDSLGTFAEMGILAPITDVISEDVMADLLPMTVEAGNYKDTQYLMPVYYETLLFMYNKAKWEGDVPETTDELYDYMVATYRCGCRNLCTGKSAFYRIQCGTGDQWFWWIYY